MASLSHSFDIALAAELGIEEAILIHHFQHWIRVNKKLNSNFREDRTWTYQTYNEIAAHFPYLSYAKVRHIIKSLVKKNIIIRGNFNKRAGDNTPWFAFKDEDKFIPPFRQESSRAYEDLSKFTGVCQNSQGSVKIDRALPDTIKTDTKKQITVIGPTSSSPSAEAESLCDFFLKKIKERSPDFKDPNLNKWRSCFDLLLRIDKRGASEARRLIEWASTHRWWKSACLSPEKLRKAWDEMTIQMNSEAEKQIIQVNLTYALKLKEKYPEQMKAMTFDDKYVINRFAGKEVPFNLPHERFKEVLISLFGGSYVASRG